MGLGLLYNMPPGLSIPCSVSPLIYSHLSQVRGHVIQPSHFLSSSLSCCIQRSVQHLFGIVVSCILSMWPSHRILWHLMNLTMFSPLIITSNSSFHQILHNSWSERENQQDATVRCLFLTISQHVSGIIMPIFRRTRRMLLHVVCSNIRQYGQKNVKKINIFSVAYCHGVYTHRFMS